MAKRKETRAERYKKVYRIVKNTYQDTALAKKSQTWSDETLYRELGIRIGKKKTPELKKINKKQRPYYSRKLAKYRQARLQSVSVKQSKKASTRGYSKKVIKNIAEYEQSLKRDYTKESFHDRKKAWSRWSKHEGMERDDKTKSYTGRRNVRDKHSFPPEIVERAIERNRNAVHVVNGKLVSMNLDDYDRYGFAYEYYAYIYNSEEKADKIVQPTPFGVESYKDTRAVVQA